MLQFSKLNRKMETRNHSKNGTNLKKLMVFFIAACVSVSLWGQASNGNLVLLDESPHDFGEISILGATTTFKFKNEGKVPVTISNVKPGCPCTAVDWYRAPIESGQTGWVKIVFTPVGLG